jgi:hypothetical protein
MQKKGDYEGDGCVNLLDGVLIWGKMDRTGDPYFKWNKPDSQRKALHVFFHT